MSMMKLRKSEIEVSILKKKLEVDKEILNLVGSLDSAGTLPLKIKELNDLYEVKVNIFANQPDPIVIVRTHPDAKDSFNTDIEGYNVIVIPDTKNEGLDTFFEVLNNPDLLHTEYDSLKEEILNVV